MERDTDQGRRRRRCTRAEGPAQRGLLSYACGELARYLTAHGLVDEIRFTVFPTVLGKGVRPFGGNGPPVALQLTGTTMFHSGVELLTYRPEVT
jgi:dihydrofolate reductase